MDHSSVHEKFKKIFEIELNEKLGVMCSSPTSHQGTYKKQNDSPLATCTK
jgi:hypothetical protein